MQKIKNKSQFKEFDNYLDEGDRTVSETVIQGRNCLVLTKKMSTDMSDVKRTLALLV